MTSIIEARVEEQLAQLTTAQKIQLTSGSDSWRTAPIPSADIPYIKLSDGPVGARGGGSFADPVAAALFPSSSCLGATFDRSLAYRMGESIARDAKTKQVHVLLGPTINMVRDPRNGRSFETYSEDALHCGEIGAAFAIGVQDTGVGACLKHFVANEAERRRRFNSSNVDQETLRNHYLRAFQVALARMREAHRSGQTKPEANNFDGCVASIMTAYNRLNRVSCSENQWLYNDVLRKEWGFRGMVVSDWFALHGHGLKVTDLDMPAPSSHRKVEQILQLLKEGREDEPTEKDIDNRARAVLRLVHQVAPLGYRKLEEEEESSPEDQAMNSIIRQVAAEGAVLLKNSADLLPLDPSRPPPRIALIGRPATEPIQSGGGSANLKPQHMSSLHSAMTSLVGDKSHLVLAPGCHTWYFPPNLPSDLVSDVQLDWYNGTGKEGEREWIGKTVPNTLDWNSLMSGGPEPPKGAKLDKETWSMSISFDITADRDMIYILQYRCFGQLRVRSEDHGVLEHVGEPDPFEYMLNPHRKMSHSVNLKRGVTQRIKVDYFPGKTNGAFGEHAFSSFTAGGSEQVDPQIEIDEAAQIASEADLAIVLVATGPAWESEGFDRTSLELPREQNALVEAVLKKQPNTIIVTIAGAAITLPFQSHSTLVHSWFGGQEHGRALCDILFGLGDAPASGRMPHTWPRALSDLPSAKEERLFPGVEEEDDTFGPNTYYDEKLALGYRHFETKGLEPACWFGGGIGGYTTFSHTALKVEGHISRTARAIALVQVRNTGQRGGKELVQLYLLDAYGVGSGRTLIAFDTVRIDAGAEQTVRLTLKSEMFSVWTESANGWRVKRGTYEVVLATSANPQDETRRVLVQVDEDWTWTGLACEANP